MTIQVSPLVLCAATSFNVYSGSSTSAFHSAFSSFVSGTDIVNERFQMFAKTKRMES